MPKSLDIVRKIKKPVIKPNLEEAITAITSPLAMAESMWHDLPEKSRKEKIKEESVIERTPVHKRKSSIFLIIFTIVLVVIALGVFFLYGKAKSLMNSLSWSVKNSTNFNENLETLSIKNNQSNAILGAQDSSILD